MYRTKTGMNSSRSPNLTLDCQTEIADFQIIKCCWTGACSIVDSLKAYEFELPTMYTSFVSLKNILTWSSSLPSESTVERLFSAPTLGGAKSYPRHQHWAIFMTVMSTPDGCRIASAELPMMGQAIGEKVAKANAVVN